VFVGLYDYLEDHRYFN